MRILLGLHGLFTLFVLHKELSCFEDPFVEFI